MSIVTPEVYSQTSVEPPWIYGEAMVTNGLQVRLALNGIGLETRGLVWSLYDIWVDEELLDGISTSWANGNPSVTTNWANSNQSITTTWIEEPAPT